MEKYTKYDFIGNVTRFILTFMVILISEENSFHEEGSNPIDPQSLSSEIYDPVLLVEENETRSSGENP